MATAIIYSGPSMLFLLLAAAPATLAAQPSATKPEQPPLVKEDSGAWLLAGREGQCTSLSILGRKGPEYSGIQSPYQLAEKLRAAGHEAEIKEFNAGSRPAVEVRAPSAGLDIMFVKKEFCDRPPPAPLK
jgi:hypothetical protein